MRHLYSHLSLPTVRSRPSNLSPIRWKEAEPSCHPLRPYWLAPLLSRRVSYLLTCLLLLSLSLLAACGDADPPPTGDLGALQLTVEGLPAGAEANIEVTGPEDYSERVTGSQTLELRPGSYAVSVQTVTYQGVSHTGLITETATASLERDIVRNETATLTVRYSSVGEVDEGEIAPGITRSGVLREGAFDDYAFRGVENVPLTFDFTDTEGNSATRYLMAVYREGNLGEPLYESLPRGAGGIDPLFGFTPRETGGYVLRVRATEGSVSYQVKAAYLNGGPEARAEPTLLSYGEGVAGAVTEGSVDRYRFTGRANQPTRLTFRHDPSDDRYRGLYRVEVTRVGESELLETETEGSPGGFSASYEVAFTLPEAGDYQVRVIGERYGQSRAGRSLVRYEVELGRGE